MELKYPIFILITIILIVILIIVIRKKKEKYNSGSKIANTYFIKNTNYYKKKIKLYKLLRLVVQANCILAIIISSILIARPIKVDTVNSTQYNRDIFLCMDVSASVNTLNLDIVETLKKTVNQLHGERFGISIFNSSSVTLVPLTDDYDYVIDVLDQIKQSINSPIYNTRKDDYYYVRNYIISGTLEGAEQNGGSLIGDGLTSCVYNFPNLDEERTRLIIFTTDNDLAGTPLVTLDTAAKISKSKKVKVFGIGTKTINNTNRQSFKNAVELTGGKYYETSNSTINSIVNDIESTSKTILKNQSETREYDLPTIPFIILVTSIFSLIIINRMVIK